MFNLSFLSRELPVLGLYLSALIEPLFMQESLETIPLQPYSGLQDVITQRSMASYLEI